MGTRRASIFRREDDQERLSTLSQPDGPRYADVADVGDFAEGLPDKFLHCRELGHLWRPHAGGKYAEGGYSRVLRCNRCKTKREQEIDSRGMILSNKYVYPEGYQVEGLGRIVGEGRGVLRLQSLVRLTKEE